jgi:UDP-3-O-[3-hydroxymyristoyl] N-acetylglucosamine deacetylase/3-hydroxyacyl-[acyl-carrier-protein] dehydratase
MLAGHPLRHAGLGSSFTTCRIVIGTREAHQVEAMAQTGGILVLSTVPDPENYLTFFMKMDNVRFKHQVNPGDTLIFNCELITPIRRGICHMRATAFVGDRLVSEAELMAQIVKTK